MCVVGFPDNPELEFLRSDVPIAASLRTPGKVARRTMFWDSRKRVYKVRAFLVRLTNTCPLVSSFLHWFKETFVSDQRSHTCIPTQALLPAMMNIILHLSECFIFSSFWAKCS